MMRIGILVLMLLLQPGAVADSVPMRDFNLLRNGMSEAEILYRLGPYDHATVAYDHHGYQHKTWYYIPAPGETSNRQWITEIHFDRRGKVIQLDRFRPR